MARLALVKPVAAFLDLIAQSEGTSTSKATHDDGYDIIVSGINGHNSFSDYSAHPFAAGRAPIIVHPAPALIESTASGRYQIILPTWKHIAAARGLGTFSPQNQDVAALELLSECHALDLIHHQQNRRCHRGMLRDVGQLPRQQLRPGRAHARLVATGVHVTARSRAVREDFTHVRIHPTRQDARSQCPPRLLPF